MNQETTQAMLKWLNQNRQHVLDLYKDQYIAYDENGIIAHDERLQPVLEQAKATGKDYLIYLVPRRRYSLQILPIQFRSVVRHEMLKVIAMQTKQPETEVKFTVTIPEIPETHRLEAETKAKEAYIMTLLRHGDISSGKAAKLLGIPRIEIFDLMNAYGISPFDDTLTKGDLQRQLTQAKQNLEKNKQ